MLAAQSGSGFRSMFVFSVSRRCHDISTIPWERTTSGSPGVNTYLCAHERRVYLPGLRWIEDFALCCRLIPPGPPDSVLVHRHGLAAPRLGGAASSRGPLPDTPLRCRYILRLHQAGSGTCRRRGFPRRGSPIRIRAVPGTQQLHSHGQSLLRSFLATQTLPVMQTLFF